MSGHPKSEHPDLRHGISPLPIAFVLAALLVLFVSGPCTAQENPFFASRVPGSPAPSVSMPAPRLQALVDAQRRIREILTEMMEQSSSGAAGIPALLVFAFVYGLLHALGPGHRKMALAAYFLARPARPRQGVTAGASVALLHAAAAVAVIYGLYYLFKGTVTATFSSVNSILELASYAAISLLGVFLLVVAVGGCVKAYKAANQAEIDRSKSTGVRPLAAIILSSGVVPCPGTALILIFCLSQDLPGVGVMAALAMSLGMAVVTVSVSLAAIFGKRGLLSVLHRGSRLGGMLHHGLEIAGAFLIAGFGLLMLSPYLLRIPI